MGARIRMGVWRYWLALGPALMLFATTGCSFFGEKSSTSNRYDPGQAPVRGVAGEDAIFLDVALVERPRGDRFLDHEVWQSGDEQGIDLELKPTLEDNGLRVCQFGVLPDRLQSLVASPRSCTPRRLRGAPDRPTAVQVGPVRDKSSFTVKSGESKSVGVAQARFEFEVVPSAEEEGAVRLRFSPRVRHGQARMKPAVARDPDGQLHWAVEPTEPTEEFPALKFDLRVNSGEYVALGSWHDRAGTLGHACFLPEREGVQYLLVLRASRVVGRGGSAGQVAPLALQARWAAARGSSR